MQWAQRSPCSERRGSQALALCQWKGFPGGSESTFQAGDVSLIPGSERSPGEGNGNSLQYSCLRNPIDRGVWWATVHEVAKSQIQLSNSTAVTFFHQWMLKPVGERVEIIGTNIFSKSLSTGASLVAQMVNNLSVMPETLVQSLEWGTPTPVFLPGESHGQRSPVGYSSRGCKESDTTERLTLSHFLPTKSLLITRYKVTFQWRKLAGTTLTNHQITISRNRTDQLPGPLDSMHKDTSSLPCYDGWPQVHDPNLITRSQSTHPEWGTSCTISDLYSSKVPMLWETNKAPGPAPEDEGLMGQGDGMQGLGFPFSVKNTVDPLAI